jgi:hypothetical protein
MSFVHDKISQVNIMKPDIDVIAPIHCNTCDAYFSTEWAFKKHLDGTYNVILIKYPMLLMTK